ncbi:hypothetical protein K402DRAFT_390438 [Aulographum hederae CBS 113979]|uniref:Late sexual development protein n=1 Tax=Aulographum hederae CBS 113979 TaxID=1176131 RepID=A0A6G1HA81_9PEZI|nr:hypothetical protein K402DRAFT_390438 [Aulographum hederae CBS 113979]
MHSFASAAVVGLCSTLVAAAPLAQGPGSFGGSGSEHGGYKPSSIMSSMSSTSTGSVSYNSGSSKGNNHDNQKAFSFPLANGFPNPNPQQLKDIEQQAFGTLPNGAPPPSISDQGVTNLQLIAFNELFEVAFFTELIQNITSNLPGYQFADKSERDFVLDTLIAVQAQEELHELNANGALKHFGKDPIQPCEYVFPVDTFDDAIALAALFTDLVLGTLQDVQEVFADNNDNGLVRGIGSVIGNEGEQEGFYRVLQKKRPNELPFLTTSTRDFAFSALQAFVAPGSCPNENEINLDIFFPLTVVTPPSAKDSLVKYQVNFSKLVTGESGSGSEGGYKSSSSSSSTKRTSSPSFSPPSNGDYSTYMSSLSLVLINQQNVPLVEKLQNVHVEGKVVTFEAEFPFTEEELNGLTIAALVRGEGPFGSADEVAEVTVAAPGLIEV